MIFLAIRYLLDRRRQTLLTLLGVFFGTMAYVSVSGFFVGFQSYLIEQLIDNTAQVHIQSRQDYINSTVLDDSFFKNKDKVVQWLSPPFGMQGYDSVQNPQSWYARLKADPRVSAFSPLLTAPALFRIAKNTITGSLIGCDPLQQANVTSIADYMVEGKFTDISVGGNQLILGDELMRKLGAVVGQYVQVTVGLTAPVPFKIVGRYRSGSRGADQQAYGTISDIQKLNHTPNRVNEIAVRLKDYSQAADMATSWSTITPEKTESWDQQNASVLSLFKIQNALRYSMIATILIVAGFGIYNVLNMTVSQKRQDIAILRSMGYDTFDVVMLFFSQGLILAVCGAILGLFCGYLFCLYLQTIPFNPPGALAGGNQGFLHISIDIYIYLQGAGLAILSASIASILPARAAGKLTPIEIIRSGG